MLLILMVFYILVWLIHSEARRERDPVLPVNKMSQAYAVE